MKRLKSFNMVYSLDDGGVQNFSVNLYKHMNHQKLRMDFVTKKDQKEFYDDAVKSIGARKIPLCRYKGNLKVLQFVDSFISAIKLFSKGYQVGYFSLKSPADALKYPLIYSVVSKRGKVVIHSHSSSDEKSGLYHKILNSLGRIFINRMGYIKFACSDKAALWMFGKKIEKEHSYFCIKNGIESADFAFDPEVRNEVRKKLGLNENDYAVIHVGRFTYAKNHEFIIKLFEQKEIVDNGIQLYLVGVGENLDTIKEYVKDNNIKNVHFLGQRKDVNMLYQAADLFILPSRYEGLPVVGVEAQTAGLHCLVSENVSGELDFTGNVEYLPLDIQKWVQRIMICSSETCSRKRMIDVAKKMDLISGHHHLKCNVYC